jgi:uncharacterized lipoprotein YmbA
MRLFPRLFLLTLTALPAACASPDPALFTLRPVAGPVAAAAPRAISLRRVSVARYLERDQIVRSSESFRIDVDHNDWWAEPPATMIGRVLQEDLSQRLPNTQVLSESGAVTSGAPLRLEVNVLRFDADARGNFILLAQAGIAGRTGEPETRSHRIVVPMPDSSVTGHVAAASTAVGQLADAIAAELPRR